MLNEKFKVRGLLPVKFVSIKPSHNIGYAKNRITFNDIGKNTPINIIRKDDGHSLPLFGLQVYLPSIKIPDKNQS